LKKGIPPVRNLVIETESSRQTRGGGACPRGRKGGDFNGEGMSHVGEEMLVPVIHERTFTCVGETRSSQGRRTGLSRLSTHISPRTCTSLRRELLPLPWGERGSPLMGIQGEDFREDISEDGG